ncbi:hypothetical protein RND71_042536 [Anisodus tanguticus]|uniref:Uncharacterized protein n=1 Tax=Anisodus tanguticus TaxID=243964 RepID=A0AAE1UUW7_9SOLA|nr:hypothetical protein RND71_042536 [Anisodus tanguticus]
MIFINWRRRQIDNTTITPTTGGVEEEDVEAPTRSLTPPSLPPPPTSVVPFLPSPPPSAISTPLPLLSPRFGCSVEIALCEYSSSSFPEVIPTGKNNNFVGSYLSTPKYFSTGFSSVHGERPTSEYARLRKESLESEFGHALTYKSKSLSSLYCYGPFLALYVASIISFFVLKLTVWGLFVHDIRRRVVKGIMNQLYDVMYDFNFSLPPDYALVIRALGSLEGTAKALDPDFKVVESAYPFVIGRLLVDPTPDMRRILRELLIRNDGSIRWNRLERLIAAISQQACETEGETQKSYMDPLGSFDIRAVVSATEDLFQFILSDKGSRVRVFLVRDIIKAADVFYQDEVLNNLLDEKLRARRLFGYEERGMLVRVVSGFHSLGRAMKLAPDLWSAMAIRMVVKPEFQRFACDIGSALISHFKYHLPVSFWMGISRILHRVVNKDEADAWNESVFE